VKRTVIVAVGVLALGVAICVGRLWAQTGARPAAAEPKTKVAVFNLTYVVKNYEKFKAFQEDLKASVTPFQGKDAAYKADADKFAKELQGPNVTQDRREQIEKQLTELKRKIEDNKQEAQKALVKKQESQLVILYGDVRTVVEKVAASRGFEMVLHFNDATTQQEYWAAPNIMRKMQAGALMPMYWSSSLDISVDIVSTLNASWKSSGGRSAAPAPTATR
jgi:Skp family chaperone for outer membrane proteins